MKRVILCMIGCACIGAMSFGQAKKTARKEKNAALFMPNLSNAEFKAGVWSIDKSGVISATADDAIWTAKEYENFELTLEFNNDVCTNSGVIIYCTDKKNWIPNAVEIQIADDHCAKWTNTDAKSRCGAVYGHLGPAKTNVKKAGEWNKMTITAKGKRIAVQVNGKKTADMDMNLWKSGATNPDGSKIPSWLPRPYAELATKGYIGFQGKHGDATIRFRNIRIKEL